MKSLAKLKSECAALELKITTDRGRESKEPYITALRDYHWRKDHPGEPLPSQIQPMLLGNWADLEPEEARYLEDHGRGWIVQPKLDGVRALLHVEADRVRITSRHVSEVTYRLGEFQNSLPHLTVGLSDLDGTILDGELVFPTANLNTGRTIALHPLQAATAILTTSPERARIMQDGPENQLRFHAFDILRFRTTDVTGQPLIERLDLLVQAINAAHNCHLQTVPSYSIGKAAVHRSILESGREGTVWKRLDQPYQPGCRVSHWLKRKRATKVEAFVTGFKPGKPGNGHENLVGALEFSVRDPDGSIQPVAWVCGWNNDDRRNMTRTNSLGQVTLNSAYMNRRAVIIGQDMAARSGRLRHARLNCWLSQP